MYLYIKEHRVKAGISVPKMVETDRTIPPHHSRHRETGRLSCFQCNSYSAGAWANA